MGTALYSTACGAQPLRLCRRLPLQLLLLLGRWLWCWRHLHLLLAVRLEREVLLLLLMGRALQQLLLLLLHANGRHATTKRWMLEAALRALTAAVRRPHLADAAQRGLLYAAAAKWLPIKLPKTLATEHVPAGLHAVAAAWLCAPHAKLVTHRRPRLLLPVHRRSGAAPLHGACSTKCACPTECAGAAAAAALHCRVQGIGHSPHGARHAAAVLHIPVLHAAIAEGRPRHRAGGHEVRRLVLHVGRKRRDQPSWQHHLRHWWRCVCGPAADGIADNAWAGLPARLD